MDLQRATENFVKSPIQDSRYFRRSRQQEPQSFTNIHNFDPRREPNMAYADKVMSWLKLLPVPHNISGNRASLPFVNNEYSRRSYPGTASEQFSDYSATSQGKMQRRGRDITKSVLERYRGEVQPPKLSDDWKSSRRRNGPPTPLPPHPSQFNFRGKWNYRGTCALPPDERYKKLAPVGYR
jgi:hypothetical protein